MVPDNQQRQYNVFCDAVRNFYSGPSNMILGLSDSLGHRELSTQEQAEDDC